MLRPPADDDAIAFFRRLKRYLPGKTQDAIGIETVQAVEIQATFKTAAQHRFQQPIIKRIDTFFAYLDLRPLAVGEACDFAGQQLVPELPSEAVGNHLRDCPAA